MEVVDYENTVEVPLNVADSNNAGASTVSNIPGVNSPMIDANVSVNNLPEGEDTTPDLVGWSTDIVRSATDYNTVAWTAGSIKLADGTSFSVDAGNTGNISAVNYIYYDGTSTLKKTTTPQDAVGTDKIMVCVVKNETSPKKATFQAFGTLGLGVLITADNIAANTITANEIASNTITATQISSSYVYAGTIDADNITSGTITGRTLQTDTDGKRIVISGTTNDIIIYDSSDNNCGSISGIYGNYGGYAVPTIKFSDYTYTDGIIFSGYNIVPTTVGDQVIGTGDFPYKDIYLTDNVWIGDHYLTSGGSYPERDANYYIPISLGITGAAAAAAGYITVYINGTSYRLLYRA